MIVHKYVGIFLYY